MAIALETNKRTKVCQKEKRRGQRYQGPIYQKKKRYQGPIYIYIYIWERNALKKKTLNSRGQNSHLYMQCEKLRSTTHFENYVHVYVYDFVSIQSEIWYFELTAYSWTQLHIQTSKALEVILHPTIDSGRNPN